MSPGGDKEAYAVVRAAREAGSALETTLMAFDDASDQALPREVGGENSRGGVLRWTHRTGWSGSLCGLLSQPILPRVLQSAHKFFQTSRCCTMA